MFRSLLDSITFFDVIAGLTVIAALFVSLAVVLAGVLYVLDLVRGASPIFRKKPPKGYQYQFVDKTGKATDSTWTKKDDYLHGRNNRN